VSLPDRLWEVLRLDPRVVAERAAFHRAYAYLEEPPFDPQAVVEMMRHGSPPGFGERVVDLLADEGRELAAYLSEHYPSRPRPPWVAAAEAADALRRAAVADLLLDTRAGKGGLIEAGRHYQEAGLPFGDFLLVAAGRGDEVVFPRPEDRLDSPQWRYSRPEDRLDPAQWRYHLLAEALLEDHLGQRDGELTATQASVAVGATSLPLLTWLRIAGLTHALDADHHETRQLLAATLGEVALAHGRQLEFAMADRYQWDGGRWNVDLVDLDLAGALAISARVMRTRDMRRWNLDRDFPGLPPTAQISVLIGLQLAEDDEDPDTLRGDVGPDQPAPDGSNDYDDVIYTVSGVAT
jgi:hypothetical protein